MQKSYPANAKVLPSVDDFVGGMNPSPATSINDSAGWVEPEREPTLECKSPDRAFSVGVRRGRQLGSVIGQGCSTLADRLN